MLNIAVSIASALQERKLGNYKLFSGPGCSKRD